MKIAVIGAVGGEVAGSAYMVQTRKARMLVDCGLFQGGKAAEAKNRPPAKVQSRLDAVVITHGHLDHSGRLPLLAKLGYKGPVLREDLKTLTTCVTAEQSKTINQCPVPCLVMVGAGMCDAGRILHHLRQNLWRPETSVIMVGHQARGSLGRLLIDGAEQVNIFGEKVAVKAKVYTLGGFSANAGQTDLLARVDAVAASKPVMAITHGEDTQRQSLAQLIKRQCKLKTVLLEQGDIIEA
jgi:predicted metal-dependent RNase